MTNAEKKAFLGRYRELERQETILWAEYKAAKLRYDNLRSPVYDGMPHGTGGGDPTALTAIKIAADDLAQRIYGQIEAKRQAREAIRDAIESLPNEAEKSVFYCRYIGGMTWEQVAVRLDYSYRHTLRLHGEGLEHLQIGEI